MTRPVYTVDLFPRPNVPAEPCLWRDVRDVCGVGLLALAGYVIILLVMT